MATSGVEGEGSGVQLKHLGLVKILLIYAVDLAWRLYGLAKQMSGPFKSTVETAERLLTPIVRPFYNKFRELTIHLLVFLDNEVEEGEGSGVQLKHLDLVKILLIYAVDLAWRLYGLAKQMSGPFKSTLEMAERLLTPLLRPFYNKFGQLTIHLLLFLDNEVDEAFHIFDKHAPHTAKDVVSKVGSVVKKASDLVNIEDKLKGTIANLGKISEAASSKIEEHAPPVLKGVLSEAKKASDLAHKALAGGPLAAISKTASSTSEGSALPITKGIVGSLFKKTSDLVQEGPMAASKKAFGIFGESPLPIGSMMEKTTDLVQEGPIAAISNVGKEASNIFDEGGLPIAKGVGSLVKKASDLAHEGPLAASGKVSEGASHIFDEGALPIAKGVGKEASNIFDEGGLPIAKDVGSLVKKASDLAHESPLAAAGKVSEGASHIFDEGALPIAKGVGSIVKKASDLVQEGPIAAISNAGKEASNIFDEGGLPIAKGVGSLFKKASDLAHEGQAGSIAKGAVFGWR